MSELTMEDLLAIPAMSKPMTRLDWVRVFRTALEKKPQPLLEQMVKLLLQSILMDSGAGDSMRAELESEISSLTVEECQLLRGTLMAARGAKGE